MSSCLCVLMMSVALASGSLFCLVLMPAMFCCRVRLLRIVLIWRCPVGVDPLSIGLIAAGSTLLSGAVSTAGSMMNNDANIDMQKTTNAQSIELANTAHQREVRDLRKSGLNPILSASGSGASTPSLTSPTAVNSLAPLAESIGQASTKGLTDWSARRDADIKYNQSWANLHATDMSAEKDRTQTQLNQVAALESAARTTSALAQARNYDADTSSKAGGALAKLIGTNPGSYAHSAGSDIASELSDLVSNVHQYNARSVSGSH